MQKLEVSGAEYVLFGLIGTLAFAGGQIAVNLSERIERDRVGLTANHDRLRDEIDARLALSKTEVNKRLRQFEAQRKEWGEITIVIIETRLNPLNEKIERSAAFAAKRIDDLQDNVLQLRELLFYTCKTEEKTDDQKATELLKPEQ